MEGLIVKGIGGFYYVETPDGKIYQCRARGLFKKQQIVPTIGDRVDMDVLDDEEGVIRSIHARKNVFIRPAVANIDQMVVLIPVAEPAPNFSVIDKLTVMAERAGVDVVVGINKTDIGEPGRISEIYGPIYETVLLCAADRGGVDDLKKLLLGRISVFTGQSGAGKSTLINSLMGRDIAKTGSVSQKTLAGRHTTRHVELFTGGSGERILDTPGFTSFEVLEGDEKELDQYYPEMKRYRGECRYRNCSHINEPGCAVRQALEGGNIDESRYASYVSQYRELEEKNRSYR